MMSKIKSLVSLYTTFDAGHNHSHRLSVTKNALELGKQYAPEFLNEIEVAATLHDVGLVGGRDGHEQRGSNMVREALMGMSNLDIICDAIAEHRASTGNPQHIVGKIVSDADRLAASSAAAAIHRAWSYRKDDHCCISRMRESLAHLVSKYGDASGYGRRVFFPESGAKLEAVYAPIVELLQNDDWIGAYECMYGINQ